MGEVAVRIEAILKSPLALGTFDGIFHYLLSIYRLYWFSVHNNKLCTKLILDKGNRDPFQKVEEESVFF